MKQLVFLMSVLLALWISGSSYWYVCKIRCDCKSSARVSEAPVASPDTLAPTPEMLLKASIDEAKTYLINAGIQKGFFESSSATGDMSTVSDEFIRKLKLYLDNSPTAKAEVTGHADITGSQSFNMELGLKRAEFVKSYLVNAGINAAQIVTSSKGSGEPAASNSTKEGRAANRRTEIKVIL